MSIGDQSYYLVNMLTEMEMSEDSFWLDVYQRQSHHLHVLR